MRLRHLVYPLIILLLLIISDRAVFYDTQHEAVFKKGFEQGGAQATHHANAQLFANMLSLHALKKSPGPFDWLAQHPEPGQTFEQYLLSKPSIPDAFQKTIYIVMLGDFDKKRQEIISKTATIISAFYQLPVKFLKPLPLAAVPQRARRTHPQTGDRQINTRTIIEDILIPLKPKQAFCLIAFTSADLWPEDGWNYVFGEASLYDRVGVWSIYRNGDPNESQVSYDLCLMRTIKTGLHEIGHMFSMRHCVYYECLMNGSNHLQEMDAQPVWLCPVCLRKVSWALKMDVNDIAKRFEKIMQLFKSNGFAEQSEFYSKLLKLF